MKSSSSFKVFTEFRLPTNTSIKVARFFGKSNCIISTFEAQLTPHLPLRDTVAGEALSTLWGSNMILQFGAIGIRSPFARVKVLLSSNTELRFSIQRVSTGPSRTNQMCSPWRGQSLTQGVSKKRNSILLKKYQCFKRNIPLYYWNILVCYQYISCYQYIPIVTNMLPI